MRNKFKVLFSELTSIGIQNILILASMALLTISYRYTIVNFDICQDYGGDFCVYWSAGKVINQKGYGAIYNFEELSSFQSEVFTQKNQTVDQNRAILYLPIFLIPFQLLANFELSSAYAIWLFIYRVGFIAYFNIHY